MNYKPIIIVAGEPNSIFFELFFKVVKKKIKSPIIIIASKKLIINQAKILKKKIDFSVTNEFEILKKSKLQKINLIDVDFKQSSGFSKISDKSNQYIENCFDIAIKLLKKNISNKFINGPVSKKNFLKKRFNGITEYLAHKTNTKKFAMIIYNKNLSVCPLTTHLPIKYVSKKINKLEIFNKVKLINNFWRKKFGKQVKIGVTGLNPHCESIDIFNEDKSII